MTKFILVDDNDNLYEGDTLEEVGENAANHNDVSVQYALGNFRVFQALELSIKMSLSVNAYIEDMPIDAEKSEERLITSESFVPAI